ncbi:MAG: chemotaxis protein CheX [Candidatus Hydrogenedentes bacterium]|nr:chemotaxis protein CheX [Candidatus Hydrogenedentota bacterium]
MLGSRVSRTGLAVSDGRKKPHEIMALIGFSGRVKGTAALAFPVETSSAMITQLIGPGPHDDETVSDAIGELVNIVAGAAKAKISEAIGEVLELSLPLVIRGDDYDVFSPSNAVWLEIPFTSGLGALTLQLSFDASLRN